MRRLGLILWVLGVLAAAERRLEPGGIAAGQLAGGGVEVYRITLAAGQYWHALVEQRGIDVVTAVYGPKGERVSEFDARPNGTDPVWLVAEAGGDYRIELQPRWPKAGAGRYRLRVRVLRGATADDRTRVAAARLLAEGDYDRSLELWTAVGDRFGRALAQYRLGLAYGERGEQQNALDAQRRALEQWRELGDAAGEAAARVALAGLYRQLGQDETALQHVRRALAASQAARDPRGEADALQVLQRLVELSRNRWIAMLERARGLYRRLGDAGAEARVLADMAMYYQHTRKRERALALLSEALELARTSEDRRAQETALQNLAYVHSYMGDFRRALDYSLEVVTLRRPGADQGALASSLLAAAEAAAELNQLHEALRYAEEAVAIVEARRAELTDLRLRTMYVRLKVDYYQSWVEVLLRLHRQEPGGPWLRKAFEVFERSRARGLLDLLPGGERRSGAGARPSRSAAAAGR